MSAAGLGRRLLDDIGGGIAMTFAIAAPVFALLACGAIDLATVASSKSALQAAADAAALNAAHQLTISDSAGIQARADQLVRAQLKDEGGFTYTVKAAVGGDGSDVTVAIDANRPSFFANLLPPGGWNVSVKSTAKPMARRPLCVLNSGPSGSDNLQLTGLAQMNAPQCMVHSNAGISVVMGAKLNAAAVQSSAAATGAIFPTAQVGAPQIADPFAAMRIKPDGLPCQLGDLLSVLGILQGTFHIPPGVHCGDITIGRNQKVVLQPGEHYFLNSRLILRHNAELVGEDVALVMGSRSSLNFSEQATVRLKGRKSGLFSGFVIATPRENTGTFAISTDNARELLGTIYAPNATLFVTGRNNSVAEESAWTVILAKQIEVAGSARLMVNAAYAGSGVPVPKGVGPLSGVALTQ